MRRTEALFALVNERQAHTARWAKRLQLPDARREYLGHQHRLATKGETRATSPQYARCFAAGAERPSRCGKKLVMLIKPTEVHRTTRESGVRKKQRTERAVAQTRQPAGQRPAWSPGKNGVCEDDDFVATEQNDLA